MNKDEFLTIEQSKELKNIGISFDSAQYCYRKINNNINPVYKYLEDCQDEFTILIDSITHTTEQDLEVIPTLSVYELLNLLLLTSSYYKDSEYSPISIFIRDRKYEIEFWDNIFTEYHHSFSDNLRDSLFDMIKWLKVNNIFNTSISCKVH